MMECLSSRVNCTLVTTLSEEEPRLKTSWNTIATRPSGRRALDAVKLGMLADRCSADIIHVVGTNALIFSPVCKLLGAHGWIGGWDRDLGPGVRKFLFRPPIDCELYRPLNVVDNHSANGGSHEYSLLYMGPLWPSRFPAENVLGALRRLLVKGFDIGLNVLTSARSSVGLCENVLTLAKRLGVDGNITLERRGLSEIERVRAYNAADAIIFPYVGPEPEQLADPPFGILESMACGRIVLSTRVLSVPEVVSDGSTGFLIENASLNDLYSGIIRALSSPDRERLGIRARDRIVRQFSYPTVRDDLLEAYKSLLSR